MTRFYCDVCGTSYLAKEESQPPTCSAQCSRIWEEENGAEYAKFYKWFKHLQHLTGSCFERDVIRDCKSALWLAWKERAVEFGRNQA